jgi:hypothetical protein
MKSIKQFVYRVRPGAALIVSMIFVLVFSALAVSLAAVSGTNVQLADNQRTVNCALTAAQSGLDCAKYLAVTCPNLPSTGDNHITLAQANATWTTFCSYVQTKKLSGKTVPSATRLAANDGDQIIIPAINFGSSTNQNLDPNFVIRLYRYDSDPNTIKLESTGTDDGTSRKITVNLNIRKSNSVMQYAIASKTRVWITGDSTIHGNIYSAWKYQNISPFNMTSDSKVEGTINTILTNINPTTGLKGQDLYAGTTKMPYDLETLDTSGNPMYDSYGNKIISSTDEIQGQSEGINYNVSYGDKATNMPGMKITDYDTTTYKNQTAAIPTSSYNTTTVTEYAPHALNNYSQPGPSGGLKLTRYVCENKTLTNAQVAVKKNALFKNCTFNGILYVDGGTSTNPNNIRFDNCIFNGPIVTTPSTDTSSGWWQRNQLYFTGASTFQNQTDVPATILAPNFSLDIGNTNPKNNGETNVLTGAIVGGLVDVRGHAEVFGTIISMFDTSSYPSGYVSNIGATLLDGGSETTAADVGVINITPNPDQMLPSGITSPIVIKPLQGTYCEGI